MNREVAMERLRAGSPVYGRPPSGVPNNAAASSPGMPPAHRRSPSASGFSAVRRTQNVAARAAAARLAQVMASQSAAAEEEEDEELEDEIPSAGGMGFRYGASRPAEGSNESAPAGGTSLLARANRSPSPALGQNFADHTPSVRASTAGRPSISVHPVPLVPPSKTTFATQTPIPPTEPPVDTCSEKRFPSDMKHLNPRGTGIHRQASSLQDELDMLQEENENIIEKLRLVEERREEAEARAKELEKQVAALGEGVSLEARLLNRKEAALQQREAVLEAIRKNKDGKNEEIAAMRKEVESAKEEVVIAKEQLRKAELEAKSLQLMTQRVILSQEEMEQVVLKRCWLARYWGLAVYYGFYPEIAVSKYEYWSSLAPLPLEVVISAGQKSMEESYNQGIHESERSKLVRDANDITGEGNIESMLSVEKGLLELTSLKVEDAVVLALSQHQRPNFVRQFLSDFKAPGEPKYMESFELSQEEIEDVTFKQAWLIYFWRRAKDHGIEEDIADERLQFWHGRIRQSPISHDFIDVERGLTELNKLGIEQQLWEASRKEIEQEP
ncbi:coiled-coil domain-containing protein SCD2-like isoform X2 [Zingiber officinale]|uniref:coiled-coil domain-containing protein SCD2-like isoform X2 n=1 Tax=Zingiber officinale TaxID=94328 RepID=UPI001C4B41A2|nr:coiled-coil domain-containing protein SCD2-like isoform X2 [Zingiber officinale]